MTPSLSSPETFRWQFAATAPEALRQALGTGAWTATAELIKRNRRRAIYRVPGTPGMIVKHDRPPGLVDCVKSLWRKAGRREYEAAELARRRGLPVPTPLGYACRGGETLFAAVELARCEKLKHTWQRAASDPDLRARLLDALRVFAGEFAAAQVHHPDMHSGNLLVQDTAGRLRCFLVDLAGARLAAGSAGSPAWDAAGWVTQLAPGITRREAAQLLRAAAVAPPGTDPMAVWQSLLLRQGRDAARRWPGRRERLLDESSLCQAVPTAEGLWRLARPFALEYAQAALKQHREQVATGHLLKDDRKRRLSRVTVAGTAYVVKEFLRPGTGLWRADRRSWLNHYRLSPEVFPVCRCHAWLEARGSGVLVLEDVGEHHLQSAARKLDAAARRPLLAAAARLVAALHAAGTVPHDLKATNLVAARPGERRGSVCLVDADAVRFGVRVTAAARAAALDQFLGNLPAAVTRRERLRVAVEYRREAGLCRAALRRLLRGVAPGCLAALRA